MDPTQAVNTAATSAYGPYWIGVAMFIAIGLFLVWAWLKVGVPTIASRVRIAEFDAKTAASLAAVAQSCENATKNALENARLLEEQRSKAH